MTTKTLNRPLQGLCVLNTRPETQGKALSKHIHDAGGIAIDCPALVILPTEDQWFGSLPNLSSINQAIFTSTNAVDYSLMRLKQHHVSWPESIFTWAIGKSTAACLKQYGLRADAIAPESTSESLLGLKPLQNVNHQNILLITGENGRSLITDTLRARGANLSIAAVYRRSRPSSLTESLQQLWNQSSIDIILFTSQEAMSNVIHYTEVPEGFFQKPCLVISHRLAKEAASLGFQTIIVSKPDAIFNALCQFNQGFVYDKTHKNPK